MDSTSSSPRHHCLHTHTSANKVSLHALMVDNSAQRATALRRLTEVRTPEQSPRLISDHSLSALSPPRQCPHSPSLSSPKNSSPSTSPWQQRVPVHTVAQGLQSSEAPPPPASSLHSVRAIYNAPVYTGPPLIAQKPVYAKPKDWTDDDARVHPRSKKQLKAALAVSLTRISDLFASWDTDKNGMIDATEFRKAVAALGLNAPDEICDAVFRDYDEDGSGEVSYKDIVFSLREALARSFTRVTDLLKKWDSDGSGTVDKQEFARAIREIGFDAPGGIVGDLFDEMDSDGSGQVGYAELHAHLSRERALKRHGQKN
jgi:Ca2+-binding EF-hand superfamily protein